jgi:hypothetical protein
VVFFCNNSPLLKKVMMQGQPMTLQSASRNRVSTRSAAPRASVKARTAARTHSSVEGPRTQAILRQPPCRASQTCHRRLPNSHQKRAGQLHPLLGSCCMLTPCRSYRLTSSSAN